MAAQESNRALLEKVIRDVQQLLDNGVDIRDVVGPCVRLAVPDAQSPRRKREKLGQDFSTPTKAPKHKPGLEIKRENKGHIGSRKAQVGKPNKKTTASHVNQALKAASAKTPAQPRGKKTGSRISSQEKSVHEKPQIEDNESQGGHRGGSVSVASSKDEGETAGGDSMDVEEPFSSEASSP